VPVYQRDHPELIHIDPYLGIYFARFNVTRPPFQDVRVRRAFAMALDNEALTKRVLKGGQQPATTFTVPDTAGYTCRSHLEHNPAEARRLLAEAGYPEGRGLPKIEYLYNTSENHKLISEAMQRMWKETLGVDVTLANQDWKVYLDSQKNMDFSMSRGSWIGDVDDAINFLECLTTDNGNNRTGWSSSAYDGLIAQSRRTPDPAQRMECFQAAEKVLLDECPIAPIYYYTRVYLLSPKVRGWQSNVLGYMSWKQIWVEEAQK
jgi:oligopeptide transport system substrate-binding protein